MFEPFIEVVGTPTSESILIYRIHNTTLGKDVPTLSQWTGLPRTTVYVQGILFASLTSSLLSAFAMLNRRWLNRHASIGMRGLAVEHTDYVEPTTET
jgi:hypothetical protein